MLKKVIILFLLSTPLFSGEDLKFAIGIKGLQTQLESNIVRGSCFSIYLPALEVIHGEESRVTDNMINSNNYKLTEGTILVADDYKYNRDVIKGFPENQDLEIIEAENGVQILEIIEKKIPDVLLLDIKMHELDGYAVINRIKKSNKYREIKIIAVTASALKSDEIELKLICDGYLRKSLVKNQLYSELIKYLIIRKKSNTISRMWGYNTTT